MITNVSGRIPCDTGSRIDFCICCFLSSLGGSGFVGQNLVEELLRQSISVFVYDRMPLHLLGQPAPRSLCEVGDVTDKEQLGKTMKSFKPTAVVHLASWGMSGAPMLDKKCWHINVEGTRISMEAAVANGVSSFVFISTYNVVFHGQEIVGGDESIARSASALHTDCYSPSKAAAEALVLAANGSPLPNSRHKMSTCVLRPAAIYGVGEQRHIPRIVRMIDMGLNLRIGRAVVDWSVPCVCVFAMCVRDYFCQALRSSAGDLPWIPWQCRGQIRAARPNLPAPISSRLKPYPLSPAPCTLTPHPKPRTRARAGCTWKIWCRRSF